MKAKLSRSLSTSSTSGVKALASKLDKDNKENRRLSVGRVYAGADSENNDFETVRFRSPNVLRHGRRCHSELTSTSTAELLAQFVASRMNEKASPEPLSEQETSSPKKIHTPLPRSTEETTRPIMSIHKETGILQVNMMWSCTKCSFAYNAMDKDVCEICTLPRSPVNNNNKEKSVSWRFFDTFDIKIMLNPSQNWGKTHLRVEFYTIQQKPVKMFRYFF